MASNEFVMDTNVLIDLLDGRRPMNKVALRLVQMAEESPLVLYIPVLSLKDAYSICRRQKMSDAAIRENLRTIIDLANTVVADVSAHDALDSLNGNEPDFEDGLVRAVAERLGVDAIISRDVDAFKDSSIPRISPTEALLAHGITVATGEQPQYDAGN